jgi:hypothetical protein
LSVRYAARLLQHHPVPEAFITARYAKRKILIATRPTGCSVPTVEIISDLSDALLFLLSDLNGSGYHRLSLFQPYYLHLLGPAGFICPDISTGWTMLEFENYPSLILPIGLNPVSKYGSAIKRRFLSFFMKVNFTPYQFLSFPFVYNPPAAFPYIILQLGKIIRMFD